MNPEDILRIIAWPILGALAGAMVTFLYNRHLAQVKSAIELHTEFHSESFLKARIKADELLKEHILEKKRFRLPDLHRACTSTLTTGADDWAGLSRVLHFFERLQVMRKAKMTHKKTLSLLLGSYINYYHSNYFKHISQEAGDWDHLAQTLLDLKSDA